MDRFRNWLSKGDNFEKFYIYTGGWIGIISSLVIPYLMRDNFELNQHNELKAAAIGIIPYTAGLVGSYLCGKMVLGKKPEVQPVKAEELTDRL